MKAVLFSLLVLIGAQAFGQNHDESSHSGDPIKSAQVYPNPAVEYLTIKFESPIAKSVRLVFHSIIGTQLELEQEIIDEYEVRVRVKDLSVGYYIVGVHDMQSSNRGIYKFLKK